MPRSQPHGTFDALLAAPADEHPQPAQSQVAELLVLAATVQVLQPQGLTVQDLATPGLVYQIGVPPVRVDILMSVDGVDFDEAWPSRMWINFGEVSGWVIGRESLIKNKLASGRPQDLLDAENLRRSSDDSAD